MDSKTVADMDDRFILVTNDLEVQAISVDCCVNPLAFGCLFVEVLDGEYGEVYGCYSSVPGLHYQVERIH